MQDWRGPWGGFRLHLRSYSCLNELTAYELLRLGNVANGYLLDNAKEGHYLLHSQRFNGNNFWILHVVRLVRLCLRLHFQFPVLVHVTWVTWMMPKSNLVSCTSYNSMKISSFRFENDVSWGVILHWYRIDLVLSGFCTFVLSSKPWGRWGFLCWYKGNGLIA